jgi:hypothetical protein
MINAPTARTRRGNLMFESPDFLRCLFFDSDTKTVIDIGRDRLRRLIAISLRGSVHNDAAHPHPLFHLETPRAVLGLAAAARGAGRRAVAVCYHFVTTSGITGLFPIGFLCIIARDRRSRSRAG